MKETLYQPFPQQVKYGLLDYFSYFQWTLDEATALLSGMESIDMEIEPEGDEDEELADIKESPENDNNPSVGEFTSDS